MTTFQEMYDETVKQSARPELVQLTKSAVSQATLFAHHTHFFPRDLELGSVLYVPTSNNPIVTIPSFISSLSQFRAVKGIQGVDSSTGIPAEEFEWREYFNFYDSDRCLKYSVYDIIGTSLKIVPIQQTGILEVLYYKNPIVSETGYSSWIADLYKEEVAKWAAMLIQARSGLLDIAKATNDLSVVPFKQMLIASHVVNDVH